MVLLLLLLVDRTRGPVLGLIGEEEELVVRWAFLCLYWMSPEEEEEGEGLLLTFLLINQFVAYYREILYRWK